jgi:hypothetical protein
MISRKLVIKAKSKEIQEKSSNMGERIHQRKSTGQISIIKT